MPFHLFLTIYGLSLALFAAPGPINLETVRHGVKRGYWSALAIQVGASGAELLWAMAVLLGVGSWLQNAWAQSAFALVGGGFLIWVALQALREGWQVQPETPAASSASAVRQGLVVGAIYALSNPLSITFWLGVAGLLATMGYTTLQPGHLGVIAAAYLLGALSWGIPMAVLATWGRHLVQPGFWRWWHTGSGLVLGGYGVHLLWTKFV